MLKLKGDENHECKRNHLQVKCCNRSLVRMNMREESAPGCAAQHRELLGYPQHQEFRGQCTQHLLQF